MRIDDLEILYIYSQKLYIDMKQGMRNKDLDAEVRKKYENFNLIMENFDKLIGN